MSQLECTEVLCSLRFLESIVQGAMDHFSYLLDQQHRFLLVGIALLVIAGIAALSGASPERGGDIVYRADEPRRYWWSVIIYLLMALFFIGLYLHQNSK